MTDGTGNDPIITHVEDGRLVVETRSELIARIRREIGAAGEGSAVDELLAERRAEAARELSD